jgi:hypothetical protein
MSEGVAERVRVTSLSGFATATQRLSQTQAISLGMLHEDLADKVEIVTTRKLRTMNGRAAPNVIARSTDHIAYRPDTTALCLIDFDKKGMPPAVENKIEAVGGPWAALMEVLPALGTTAIVTRASTSAGLYNANTNKRLDGSGGLHVYIVVADGTDIERFLRVLHARCWLRGYGWMIVGRSGQLLERSIVDRMVGGPERLVFEGPPLLVQPVAQSASDRRPMVTDGQVLQTRSVCLDLSMVEESRLRDFRSAEMRRLERKVAEARSVFFKHQTELLRERTGCTPAHAKRLVERQCEGILLPDLVLPWDSPDLACSTVSDVLRDPDRFDGATLADPLEGVEYGLGKAKVLRRPDGTPWIHSFAHGRTVYELRYDAAAVEAAIMAADPSKADDVFVELAPRAELDPLEEQALRDLVIKRSDVKARPLAARLKQARENASEGRRRAEQAEGRHDGRLRLEAPAAAEERLIVMTALDEVLIGVAGPEPPMRDISGRPIAVACRQPFNLHAAKSNGTNANETDTPPSA